MVKPGYLPSSERLSVLAATILLAYALARFIKLPQREFAVQLPGLYLAVQLNVRTFVSLLVAGLTATGAEWLLSDHPGIRGRSTVEHWLLPALTAWVIGLPLYDLPFGPFWWMGIFLSGGLLTLVLIAEYISVDPEDLRQPAAASGLIAVSFALFLALAGSLRFEGVRLFLLLPALAFAACLVSLRALHLRLHGQWLWLPGLAITLVVVQFAAALHYWPLSPIAFGLVLLGPAYGLTSLVANLAEGASLRQALVEPALVMAAVLGATVWLR